MDRNSRSLLILEKRELVLPFAEWNLLKEQQVRGTVRPAERSLD